MNAGTNMGPMERKRRPGRPAMGRTDSRRHVYFIAVYIFITGKLIRRYNGIRILL